MIHCNNSGCIFSYPLKEPVEFKFGKFIIPIVPIIVYRFCTIQPAIEDVEIEVGDFKYNVAICLKKPGMCEKDICLWNNMGACQREDIYVDECFFGDQSFWVCRTISDKKISGHMDWSRYPQGGPIETEYAEKLNVEATKFKSFSKGHHEARELPSMIEKQHREWEKDRLRGDWYDKRAKQTRNIRIKG